MELARLAEVSLMAVVSLETALALASRKACRKLLSLFPFLRSRGMIELFRIE